MPSNIAIVGGGIGGLAAALALIRRGIDVDVYEQAPELRELGAGVQISANGSRVLHALGLAAALEKVQVEPAGKAVRLWDTGQTWKMFDLGSELVERYGSPYLTLHRSDLHNAIAQAVLHEKPDAIHLGHKCIGLTQTADYVELRFEGRPAVTAKLVIGADGVHSVLRGILFGTPQPQFCGITVWRGVVPMGNASAHRLAHGRQHNGPGRAVTPCSIRCARGRFSTSLVSSSAATGRSKAGTFAAPPRNLPTTFAAGTRTSMRSSAASRCRTNGRWRCGLQWTRGAKAAARFSAMPAIRWCPFWPKAPSWRSKMRWFSRVPRKISARSRHGIRALRGGARSSGQQGGHRLGGYDSAPAQPRLGRRRRTRKPTLRANGRRTASANATTGCSFTMPRRCRCESSCRSTGLRSVLISVA